MKLSQIAAQLYTVREFTQTAKGLAQSLKKIRDIGYTAVQISAIGPIPDQEVKTIVDDLGLTICNTHVRPEDKPWADLEAVIEQHHCWNCQHVAIGIMPQRYRGQGEDGFKRFAQEASQIGERFHKEGLTFSYHNHSFEFVRFGTRTGLDILFDESDPRYLQAELDTYWLQYGGGDPVEWVKKVSDRMPVVHLKDMVIADNGKYDGVQMIAEIGEGNLNWSAILQACREAQVEWYAVEQDVCQRDPFESLKISYDNLKTLCNLR
jgi:sugar phosphate isomerase/epimerase